MKDTFYHRVLTKLKLYPSSEEFERDIQATHYDDFIGRDVWLIWVLLWSWALLIIASILVVFSLILDLSMGCHYNLFPRSGAMLVIASLFVQVRSRREYSFGPEVSACSSERYKWLRRKFNIWGWYMTGLGTLIWAYGDLVIGLILNTTC